MQLEWTREAESRPISPISHPDEVLDFIQRMPGLRETCEEMPLLVAENAPQLTIPGFGGFLEEFFEAEYLSNLEKRLGTSGGTGLTVSGSVPECDEEWALRSSTFAGYQAPLITCSYFSGGVFGPEVSPFGHTDHLFWLLSDDSIWLPPLVRAYLTKGFREWHVWEWTGVSGNDHGGLWPSNGCLWEALHDSADTGRELEWDEQTRDDLESRIQQSVVELSLSTKPEDISRRFIEGRFAEDYIRGIEKRTRTEE